MQIANMVKVGVSVRRIQQMFSSSPFLRYTKDKKRPYLLLRHKISKVNFASDMLANRTVDWNSVIFTEEKKHNLDGSDSLKDY